MIKLDSPLASTDEEINGVDRDIGGITFRIRPFGEGNRKAMAVFARLKGVDSESAQAVVMDNLPEVLSALVTGWSGMVDTDGNEIEYSADKAIELFSEHDRIAQAVFVVAGELGSDESDELEEDEKN